MSYAKQVTSIGFIGTGGDIVSSGGDKTVRFHHTADGENYRTFEGGTDFMYSAAATGDGSLVVAGGEDGVLRVWEWHRRENRFSPSRPSRPRATRPRPTPPSDSGALRLPWSFVSCFSGWCLENPPASMLPPCCFFFGPLRVTSPFDFGRNTNRTRHVAAACRPTVSRAGDRSIDPHTHINPHAAGPRPWPTSLGITTTPNWSIRPVCPRERIEAAGLGPKEKVHRLVEWLGPLENTVQASWLLEMCCVLRFP